MTITLTREEAQQVLDDVACLVSYAERAGQGREIAWQSVVEDIGEDVKKSLETIRARLSAREPEQIEIETLKQCLFQMQESSKEQTKAFDRLVRIMGTFDLATGHADGWNDLLDSLESELRDVLGHYREALKARQEPEPVAWRFYYKNMWSYVDNISDLSRHKFEPLYTAPPKREWQTLTDHERELLARRIIKEITYVEALLQEKNI